MNSSTSTKQGQTLPPASRWKIKSPQGEIWRHPDGSPVIFLSYTSAAAFRNALNAAARKSGLPPVWFVSPQAQPKPKEKPNDQTQP